MDGVGKFTKKWFEWAFQTSGMLSFCIFCAWIAFEIFFSSLLDSKSNERDFVKRYLSPEVTNVTFNDGYLTHRLIKMDLNYGITTVPIQQKALGNVNQFLEEVSNKCPWQDTDKGVFSYVACANERLHDIFYYTPSVDVSNNYAIHRSDCDTNTYLMMDALKMKGRYAYIIYAPGHAFLAWKDSFGNLNYWETTSGNNKGQLASLSDKLYDKAFERTYYTPVNDVKAEKIYNALIYTKSQVRVDIARLYNDNRDNAIISDWYFSARDEKKKITRDEAQLIISLLNTDFTSVDKKLAVVHYMMQHNQKENASVIFGTIPYEKCGRDCFVTGADMGNVVYIFFRKPFLIYDDFLRKHASGAYLNDFYGGVFFSISALIFGVCVLILPRRSFIKIKNSTETKNHSDATVA